MGQPLHRSLKGEGYNTVFQRAVKWRESLPPPGKERRASGVRPSNELLRQRSGSLLRAPCFHLMGQMSISTWIKGILPQGFLLFGWYGHLYLLSRTLKMKRCLTSSRTVSPHSSKCTQRETSPERTNEDDPGKSAGEQRVNCSLLDYTANCWLVKP